MFFHVSNYTNQSASLESVSCLRRKRDYVVAPEFIGGPTSLPTGNRDYVVAPEFIGGPTSLPTGNRAPSGAVIFSRVECFNLSRHIRRRTDQPVAPHPQADRPTFHYRTCIKHNQKRGTEMADSRGRRHELVEPETCATRRGAQRTSAASNQIPEE